MLKDLFSFNYGSEFAIGFTQLNFWILFLFAMIGLAIWGKKPLMKTIFFTAISLFFYFKTSGVSVVILLFSMGINYFSARWIHSATTVKYRQIILILAVALNLLVLAYFKYAFFFTESFNAMFQTDFKALNYFAQWSSGFTGKGSLADQILVPAGVSFFTFQSISYVVDVHRKDIKPVHNFFEYSFFITFFPHILMGPIARAKDFIPQIRQPHALSQNEFSEALVMILRGFIKKLVLADYMAVHFVDKVTDAPEAYPGFVGIIAMWAYSLQIYGDFSGYTDMATGIARLMGFKLFQNFDSPYKALNVADFWRRWHRSLGAWLKNYLYIPLGGNKSGGWGTYILTFCIFLFLVFITRWYGLFFVYIGVTVFYLLAAKYIPSFTKYVHRDLNLLITMVVGGLWHGASMNFVIWGTMNGLALILYNHWKKISPYENSNRKLAHIWKILLTFNFITFTRIWFVMQGNDEPLAFLEHVWNHFGFDIDTFVKVTSTFLSVFLIMVLGFIIHWLPAKTKNAITTRFVNLSIYFQVVVVALIIFMVYQAVSNETRGFVYFSY